MPRHSREQSATGIYHVMLRGVNRQSIFEDDEDCIKLINLLRNLVQRFDDKGRPLPALCTIYAYCLMDNHIHLLVKEHIQTFKRKERNYIIESALKHGLGVRQLARITGVSYGIIQRINEKVGRRTVP